jgi:hypothetical protein
MVVSLLDYTKVISCIRRQFVKRTKNDDKYEYISQRREYRFR